MSRYAKVCKIEKIYWEIETLLELILDNVQEINRLFHISFETLYLVLYYGDFKNEGVDELKYFNDIYIDLNKHEQEIRFIIKIFKEDFTPLTRKIAIEFISNGFLLTDHLTKIINDRHSTLS